MNLEVKVGKARLASPLIGASGLFGYGGEYEDLLDLGLFGAIVSKTITLKPKDGNPSPRIVDVDSGIINSIGLENVGSEPFFDNLLPELDLPCEIILSIGGETAAEYRELAGMAQGHEAIAALEVNISCPNVRKGGIAFGSDPESTCEVVGAVRGETDLPVLAKLPPLVTGIEAVCRAACDAGADALTIANTYPAMAIDVDEARPVLGAVSGGLSGRAVKPMTLLLVWKVAGAFDVPVFAVGGIETWQDAIEFMLAGASAFQIGSIILRDMNAPRRIVNGIESYMKRNGYRSLEDFRGKARQEV
jgi:dihydroorotate dehydrogenase (NAD+) catalytic subunit